MRGRAGRQGDPGSTRFYLSLDDELMRRFGTDRIRGLMGKLGMDDDTPIEHGIISKSIESAQTKVEGHNSDIRRHVVQYDDVMNRHREVIYADRGRIVAGDDMSDKMDELVTEELEAIVDRNMAAKGADIDYETVAQEYNALFPLESGAERVTVDEIAGLVARRSARSLLQEDADEAYQEVEDRFGSEAMRQVERHVLLSVIDRLWVEHLTTMDELREGVGSAGLRSKGPASGLQDRRLPNVRNAHRSHSPRHRSHDFPCETGHRRAAGADPNHRRGDHRPIDPMTRSNRRQRAKRSARMRLARVAVARSTSTATGEFAVAPPKILRSTLAFLAGAIRDHDQSTAGGFGDRFRLPPALFIHEDDVDHRSGRCQPSERGDHLLGRILGLVRGCFRIFLGLVRTSFGIFLALMGGRFDLLLALVGFGDDLGLRVFARFLDTVGCAVPVVIVDYRTSSGRRRGRAAP